MIPTKIAGVLLAVVLVTTGVAAATAGNAPAAADAGQADDYEDERADAEADHEDDDSDADADDRANGPAVAAEHRGGAGSAGEERAQERHEEFAQERHEESVQERSANASQRGPPVNMPDQVPDFVSEIHGVIGDFLSGDFTGDLGAAISDLTPGEEAEGNESATEVNESATDGNDSTTDGNESATVSDHPEPATAAVGGA